MRKTEEENTEMINMIIYVCPNQPTNQPTIATTTI